jgi:hypothetical protein
VHICLPQHQYQHYPSSTSTQAPAYTRLFISRVVTALESQLFQPLGYSASSFLTTLAFSTLLLGLSRTCSFALLLCALAKAGDQIQQAVA